MANILSLVSFTIYPAYMGGQKGVALFYQYLAKYHRIVLALPQRNTNSEDRDIVQKKMLFSNRLLPLNILRIQQLIRLIKKEKIHVIIAEHSYTGWIALLLKKLTGTPFIIHSHNLEWNRFRLMNRWWWKLYKMYEKWIHKKADFSFFKTEEEYKKALISFGLEAAKCTVIPYGLEEINIKTEKEKEAWRKSIGIKKGTLLFLFNGTLDYYPNKKAVQLIIEKIDSLLHAQIPDYKIVITGKNLSHRLQKAIDKHPRITYAGFMADIHLIYQATDLFLNPVVNDSGVKTKVIEAIANHSTVISTRSGVSGVPENICGEQLKVANDYDWPQFIQCIKSAITKEKQKTKDAFYTYFYWKNITTKAATHIQHVVDKNA